MEMSDFFQKLEAEKLLPLYTATDLEYVEAAKDVLVKNGLHFIEVTYRSDVAGQAIKKFSQYSDLIVGAGTVKDLDTAKDAVKNGAQFIVSPGFDDEVVQYCLDNNIPVVPGAVTPTEIMRAKSFGLDVVKFFPANVYGGLKAIKSLSGPFPEMKFVPTGGVNKDNYKEFLANPNIPVVGGSFIISEKTVMKDNGVTAAKELAELVK